MAANCVSSLERVGRVARENRDVVALGRIQMDRVREEGRFPVSGKILPANTVAHVAHRCHTANRLARFAGQWTCAARCYDRHVAGMEVRPKGWNDARRVSRRRRAWAARWRGVCCTGRVDVEGAVFLNDPAIVGNRS